MAKKKTTKKKVVRASGKKSTRTTTSKKKTGKKATAKKSVVRKKSAARTKKAAAGKKSTARKKPTAKKTQPAAKSATRKNVVKKSVPKKKAAAKKGRKLGRSRIPVDTLLELVFQKDLESRQAFEFLDVRTIRELESFTPDELVQRLQSPIIKTVGRIRKVLAMNNRHLKGDERFAIQFQRELSREL